MPLVWELRCHKRNRSRRTLYHEGIAALRRDAGVRRIESSKTHTLFCAKITFWNDEGPVDQRLGWLREEFSYASLGRHEVQPQDPHDALARRVYMDLETSRLDQYSMGARFPINYCEEECRIIEAHLTSPAGRAGLAASMAQPLRRRMGMTDLARRTLPIEQLPIPSGTVYITSGPEFVGRIPARTELTVLGPDDPTRPMLGFSMCEQRIEPMTIPTGNIFLMDSVGLFVPIPEWCVIGRWAYDEKTGRYAIVESIAGDNQAEVRYWYRGRLVRRTRMISGRDLRSHWMPCEGPKMPRKSWWEDLDDGF